MHRHLVQGILVDLFMSAVLHNVKSVISVRTSPKTPMAVSKLFQIPIHKSLRAKLDRIVIYFLIQGNRVSIPAELGTGGESIAIVLIVLRKNVWHSRLQERSPAKCFLHHSSNIWQSRPVCESR